MGAVYALAVCGVAGSAIVAKEFRVSDPLAAVDIIPAAAAEATVLPSLVVEPERPDALDAAVAEDAAAPKVDDQPAYPPETRWFNGRPVRPVRIMTMSVTGYSPDERSCGDSADGLTATLHPVSTNGHHLVAADTRVLPFGSMLSIPGYDSELIVPVLDRGSKIKGRRLDLLFPTHEEAREWGVRRVQVTIWGYADGKPADDPRALR